MAVSREEVDAWFAANPNATGDQVVAAVQSIGGLDANAGLAEILANRYTTTPDEVKNYYTNAIGSTGALTQASTTPTFTNPLNSASSVDNLSLAQGLDMSGASTATKPLTVEDLYQQYAGRASDPEGLAYWTAGFGDTIDPSEVASFQSAVAAARAQGTEPAAGSTQVVTTSPLSNELVVGGNQAVTSAPLAVSSDNAYFQQNPDVAAEYAKNSQGMTPEQFAATHYQKFGAAEQRAAPVDDFNKIVTDAYAAIGRTGFGTEASNIDQAGFDNFVNALKTGAISAKDFGSTFTGAVAEYLAANPTDKYSTYVTDYLQDNKASEIAGVQNLYQDVLGRDADPSGLGTWYKKFGSEISPEERAEFERAADPELKSRVTDLYTDMLGRTADQEGLDYWTKKFGSDVTDDEREEFRKSAATELTSKFGGEKPDDAAMLAGFKYAKDLGISNEKLKSVLGEDLFNAYDKSLTNFAVTNLTNIVADNKLTWSEAQKIYNFGKDLGFKPEDLARITGQDKSVFDLANTNYVKGRDQIINDTLNDKKLTTDADKIISAVALQNEFNFTDEEFSQATGKDIKDIKAVLDPVRNFEKDFTGVFQNTDTTTGDAKSFVEKARGNAAINKLYGDSLNEVETNIKKLEEKWKPYGSDPLQTETLSRQLTAQRDALGGEYYKGVYGDLNSSAAQLNKKGLDTIKDLGQKDKFETQDVAVQRTTADGRAISRIVDGKFFVEDGTYSGGSDDYQPNYKEIPADQVKTVYGRTEIVGGGENYTYEFVPLTKDEISTLSEDGTKFQKKIGSVVIDKDTGKELTGLDGVLLYDKTGPWYKEYKNYLNTQFTADGTPILTASREKAGLYAFVSDVTPMVLSLASIIPGPHQPFAKLASAALALEQKNYIGAVLNGFGAVGSFAGSELAMLEAADAAGDIVDASRMLELKDTVSNIKLATTFVQGAAALEAGNIPGLINASLSGYTQLNDAPLPSGVTTSLQLGNLAISLNNKQYDQALNALGDLTGSSDVKLAGAAATLVDAIQKAGETGDYSGVVTAGMGLAQVVKAGPSSASDTGGITNRVVDDAVAQGSGSSDAAVDAFTAAKNAGATDQEAMDAANAVTGTVVSKTAGDGTGTSTSVSTTTNTQVADNRAQNTLVLSNTDADTLDEAAALAISKGNDSFSIGGKTYIVNASQGDLSADDKAAADARLVNGYVKALGKTDVSQLTDSERNTYLNNYDKFTANGTGVLKAATIQDVLSGNSTYSAAESYNNTIYTEENPFKVEIVGYRNDLEKVEQEESNVDDAFTDLKSWADSLKGPEADTIKQLISTTAGLFGEQFADLGTAASQTGLFGRYNALVQFGQKLEKLGSDLEIPGVTAATANFWDKIGKANTFGDKLLAGVMAVKDQPLALVNVGKEIGQEALPILLGGAAFKYGGKTLGILVDASANGLESMGSTNRQTFKDEIAKGTPPEQAERIAAGNGLIALAITTGTAGLVDTSLVKGYEKAMQKIGGRVTSSAATELPQEAGEEFLIAIATGDDVATALTKAAGGGLIGGKTSGAISAASGSGSADVQQAARDEVKSAFAEQGLTSTDGSFRPETIVKITETGADSSVTGGSGATVTEVGSGASTAGATGSTGTTTAADISNNVTTQITSGADVSTVVGGTVTDAIGSGANASTVINSTVTSSITAGADASTVVGSAVTSSITAGASTSTAVGTTVGSAITAGGDASTVVGSAVTASVTAGANVDSTIASSISSSIVAGADANTVVTAAVDAATKAGNDVTVASDANTTTITNATTNTTTTVNNSTGVTTTVDANTNVTTTVDANTNTTTTVDANTNTTTTVDANTNTTTTVDANTNVTTTVDANTNTTTTVDGNANTTTTVDANANTTTTTNNTTGVSTTVDANTNVTTTVDANTNTTTAVDANTGTTTQTTVNGNTQTTVVADSNTNTNTKTTVDSNTNTTVSTTVDANTNTTTQTTTDTKTQTTVVTNVDTNTQTTVKVNIDTGDVIEVKETDVPDGWTPPVIELTVVPDGSSSSTSTSTAATTKTTTPAKASPTAKLSGAGAAITGGAMGLPSGFDMDSDPLGSRVTQGRIDPLARVKEAQAELEREVMMNQIDPRLLSVMQQRMDPNQQSKQLDQDVGALAKLLRGEAPDPSRPAPEASSEGKYYSYGSEDSIDDILGGKAASYKEGGFVEPLKASGGSMALPLLAKSGGALGKYNGREDFKGGKHVAGDGDGQSDDIPAWLADGEFVFPADVVSALGNGSTKAGTDKLYAMMHGIRDRARSKGPKDLPPPALKSPLDYLKSSKRSSK